jgi:hypothetical protein
MTDHPHRHPTTTTTIARHAGRPDETGSARHDHRRGHEGAPARTGGPRRIHAGGPAAEPPAGTPTADLTVITVLALATWVLLVFLSRVWAMYLETEGHRLVLYTPPILGGYRVGLNAAFALPVVTAGLLVALLPRWTSRLAWSRAVVTGCAGALAWWVSLALVDGPAGLTDGLEWPADFATVLPGVMASPRRWLGGFTAGVIHDNIQIRAHPPGLPLLLAALGRLHLGGAAWAAGVVLASAAAGVAAVAVAVRELAGEDVARRALPFVALAPAAIWIATSFDALYLGVAAWFVTTMVLAMGAGGRRADVLAAVAGLLAAATIMLSYGLVLMGAIVVVVAVVRRRWRPVAVAAATALAAIAAFVPFGFWWPSGLGATREAYYALGLDRPYSYFAVADFGAWALVLGPATAVALARLRDARLWLLVGGAVLATVIATISGLSTGEVERIWLPFSIWVLPAGAVLAGRGRAGSGRGWLGLQVASALVVVALIRPVW